MEKETQELVRRTIKVGNSAGVLLPRSWLNGVVKVELIKKEETVKKDIINILGEHLEEIIGIYLAGSYARNEQREGSDIDILAISKNLNMQKKEGNFSIIVIPEKELEKSMKRNALPLLAMIKEAKIILNESAIEKYKDVKLDSINLRPFLELTKSALEVNRKAIELTRDRNVNCHDSIAYSIVLRIRGLLTAESILKNQQFSNKKLKEAIKEKAGSLIAYEGYLRIKEERKPKDELPLEEAEKLYDYAIKKLGEVRKWAEKRKS